MVETVSEEVIAMGQRLAQMREMVRLKRYELAKLADVDTSSISLWEHGRIPTGMTQKSIKKILDAFKKAGLEASIEWFQSGKGAGPKLINPFLVDFNQANISETPHTLNEDLIKLATNLSDEIINFSSLTHLAVVTKLEHGGFAPYIKKGSFVGGVWQPSSSLKEEEICIFKIEDKLNVGLIMRNKEEELFNISYALISSNNATEKLSNIKLDTIAPVIRIWR
ncbi:MAG TPA: helix-turn-helix transcriptional regulator [Gammaproteobacteria bacterium]|jgi:transcriptional regulator with XRE-family HTH domain|nr:helix-turn-helix transcriptional regulator [Gammaproteobacteria bacterium]